jgi:hypothetical protein
MSQSSFQSLLRMWTAPNEVSSSIFQQGILAIKTLASLGGITFTIAFLYLSMRLSVITSVEQRNRVLLKMVFTGIVALIHFSAWQLAPKIQRIFFYPLEGLSVEDRLIYVVRWIASLGGVVFTLSFMGLGLYAAFYGLKPHHRNKFFIGLTSTGIGMTTFYSAWLLAPLIAGGGTSSEHIDDKPLFLVRMVGSVGTVLFTFAFIWIAFRIGLGGIKSEARRKLYSGLVLAFVGAFIFYTAWQFAPAIANTLLPPGCESTFNQEGCS